MSWISGRSRVLEIVDAEDMDGYTVVGEVSCIRGCSVGY